MAMGALSGAAFYGVGNAFQACTACQSGADGVFCTELTAAAFAGKVFAHAMVGGAMGVLQGAKFGHGFAAAGVTQAFAGKIDSIGGNSAAAGYFDAGNRIMRIAVAAAVGGTTSSITGGKFANGAMTGAFSRMFNDEAAAHVQKDPVVELIKEKMSGYSKGDLKDMEVGILVYRDGDGALQAISVEGKHTNVRLGVLYGQARALGSIEYVAEFHSHPVSGGSYSLSPNDVAEAYSVANQIKGSSPNYRAFFSDPKGRVYEWNPYISSTKQANKARREVGRLW